MCRPCCEVSILSSGLLVLSISYLRSMGMWMRMENRKRNRAQGVNLRPEDVKTEELAAGPDSPFFRYMY